MSTWGYITQVLVVCEEEKSVFKNRFEAGRLLGKQLAAFSTSADLIIGLARGGVMVAAGVASILNIPFTALVVKKIGSPGNPELAIGARVPAGQTIDVRGSAVILTDDGAATGATMDAAIRWVSGHGVRKIIVVLPVAPPDVVEKFQTLVSDVVVLEKPATFGAVGEFYRDFTQVTDEDVVQLLS
jgi:predicted phosphoribosyltransferase